MYSSIKIFVLLLLCSVACTRAAGVPQDTLVVGLEAFPQKLDPRFAVDALSSKINKLVYNGLFKLDAKLLVQMDLAESIQTPTPTEWVITIKKNVSFHNGNKLTTKDILYTFESIRDPKTASPHRGVFEQIKNIVALDDYSLKIELLQPFAPLLTGLNIGIVPAGSPIEGFTPMGTGPYRFKSQTRGEVVLLERFDDYFGTKARTKNIFFRSIYEDTLRTLEVMKGRLDLVQNAIPHVLLPAVKKSKNIVVTESSGINFTYMGLNLKDPILNNPKVRQAVAMAINRDEMIKYKLKGLALPATSLLAPDHWAFAAELKPQIYDPARAKRLLDEAGYADPPGAPPRFSLVYKTSTKRDRVEMAFLLADYLQQVGIEVAVKPYEFGTLFQDIRTGNFQIFTLTWVGLTEPDIYYYVFHSSQLPPDGGNRGFYHNPQVDTLVEQGRRTLDLPERKKIYDKVQETIFAELPTIPLWYENNWLVTNKKVQGYSLRPDAGFENLVNAYKD